MIPMASNSNESSSQTIQPRKRVRFTFADVPGVNEDTELVEQNQEQKGNMATEAAMGLVKTAGEHAQLVCTFGDYDVHGFRSLSGLVEQMVQNITDPINPRKFSIFNANPCTDDMFTPGRNIPLQDEDAWRQIWCSPNTQPVTKSSYYILFEPPAPLVGMKRPLASDEANEAVSSSSIPLFSPVVGVLKGSRNYTGVRQEVYRRAGKLGGCYGNGTEEESIYYCASHQPAHGIATADLHFRLLFPSMERAFDFMGVLHEYLDFVHFHVGRQSNLQVLAAEPHNIQEVKLVTLQDYNTRKQAEVDSQADGQSPMCDSVISATTVIDVLNDPACMLQIIEDERILRSENLKLYACHIYPKAERTYDKELSNRLFMSGLFHNYYDGMQTLKQLPHFAVKFIGCGESKPFTFDSPTAVLKTKIWIELEWVEGVDHACFEERLKEGTKKTDHNKWKSFIWVDNPTVAQQCLEFKYEKTIEAWREYQPMQAPLEDSDVDELIGDP